MPAVFGVIAVISAITSAIGAGMDASSKADAAVKDAQLKNSQAGELLSREQVNEGIIQQQSELAQGQYGAAFASTGREGAGIGGILRMRANTALTISNARRDAEFKASMLRQGANIATNLASDELTAGYITGSGTLLTSGLKIANSMGAFDSAQNKQLAKVDPITGVNGGT